MKGLLLKDIYTQMKQSKIFLLLIVVFSFMGDYMAAFAVVYASMLPITALAYDERNKWDILAAMMPYSPKDIVLSKYVLGYFGVAAACVLSAAAQAIIGIIRHTGFELESLTSLVLIAFIATILLSINLPLMFKMGVEKGRLMFIALTALIVVIGMGGGVWITRTVSGLFTSPATLFIVALAVTVIINIASIALSIKVYKRKME